MYEMPRTLKDYEQVLEIKNLTPKNRLQNLQTYIQEIGYHIKGALIDDDSDYLRELDQKHQRAENEIERLKLDPEDLNELQQHFPISINK